MSVPGSLAKRSLVHPLPMSIWKNFFFLKTCSDAGYLRKTTVFRGFPHVSSIALSYFILYQNSSYNIIIFFYMELCFSIYIAIFISERLFSLHHKVMQLNCILLFLSYDQYYMILEVENLIKVRWVWMNSIQFNSPKNKQKLSNFNFNIYSKQSYEPNETAENIFVLLERDSNAIKFSKTYLHWDQFFPR